MGYVGSREALKICHHNKYVSTLSLRLVLAIALYAKAYRTLYFYLYKIFIRFLLHK